MWPKDAAAAWNVAEAMRLQIEAAVARSVPSIANIDLTAADFRFGRGSENGSPPLPIASIGFFFTTQARQRATTTSIKNMKP